MKNRRSNVYIHPKKVGPETEVGPRDRGWTQQKSKSRPNAGIVEFAHTAINQRGEIVAECTRQALMHKKPKG